jgi:DNA-binding MarR family transcriptional regulator
MTTPVDIQFASEFRAAINQLSKKLRRISPTAQHLSHTERSTMSQLYQRDAMLPSELAATELITNQSMSQVLNHLEQLGYISRVSSEADKRKVHISLTEKGKAVFLQFKHERDEWMLKAITTTCTPEEQEQLKLVIGSLSNIGAFN